MVLDVPPLASSVSSGDARSSRSLKPAEDQCTKFEPPGDCSFSSLFIDKGAQLYANRMEGVVKDGWWAADGGEEVFEAVCSFIGVVVLPTFCTHFPEEGLVVWRDLAAASLGTE